MKIFNIKISKTWLVIIIIILMVAGYYVAKPFFKSPTEGLIIEKVQRGEVLQEVSETGSVRAAENISLGFKSIGKIANINVAVGDSVKKGDVLAELDSSQLLAQLQSVRAALSYTINQHDSGVALAKDNLQSAYNSVLSVLEDAYTKIYNSYGAVTDLQNTYFTGFDQGARDGKTQIKNAFALLELSLEEAKTSRLPEKIDSALSVGIYSINTVSDALKVIRDTLDEIYYYGRISDSEKTAIDTQKTNINTALTNLTAGQASISSYKIALQKAEDGAVDSGVVGSVSGSQAEQAQANVNALQSQLDDNYLISPINGIITGINIKKGEVVSPSQLVINMLSSEPFQIKAAIYEQDIVNVKVGDDVRINLVAFPKQIFDGKVLLIDPAETIVDNVVYYEVTIEFPDQPDGIKSGMTADVVIEANKKEGVLRIPKNAVVQIGTTETVQIVKDDKIEDHVITTGLEGNEYFEVTSGLSEGEEIITGKQ